MMQEVGANPLVFALGCIVWIPVAIWVISLIGWMISGEVEALYGVPAALLIVVLGFFTTKPPEPWLSPVLFFAIICSGALYPVARLMLNRRAHARIDVELLENLYDTLYDKPGNVGAKFRMAEVLYNRGLIGQAVAIGEDLLTAMPKPMFDAEHRVVAGWKAVAKDPNLFRPLSCPACGMFNAPGTLWCRRCGDPYLIEVARGRWLKPVVFRRFLAAWVAAMIVIVAIPVTLRAPGFPVPLTVALIVVEMAIGGVVLYRAFVHSSVRT